VREVEPRQPRLRAPAVDVALFLKCLGERGEDRVGTDRRIQDAPRLHALGA
jgi:hypothetical protein